MKRHLTASRGSSGTGGGELAGLESVSTRLHTLVLTGQLTYDSVHALETEIERCCAEGVTGITLDLRRLEHIDPIGVAVVAFRARLCERRGYDFSLIAGGPPVHRMFEDAGVSESLPFRDEWPVPPARVAAATPGERPQSHRRLRAVI
jgi:anti-anti-sigma factor